MALEVVEGRLAVRSAESRSQFEADGFVRVRFPLCRDEDGWPPSEVETLWCRVVAWPRCRVDNIPIYARGIAVDDVIEVTQNDDDITFARVAKSCGHGTVRVIFVDGHGTDSPGGSPLWQSLLSEGCTFEGLTASKLYALDVPSVEVFTQIRETLERGVQCRIWDYEEGKLPA